MTPKEALFRVSLRYGFVDEKDQEALDILENMVAKATPMKPISNKGFMFCQCCFEKVYTNTDEKYCAHCGQTLDWAMKK
jgi:ribosomal protein L37E